MDHHFPPPNPADAQYYNYPTPPPESLMGVDQIVTLVERVGLPAVIIAAAFWFIRYQSEQSKVEREEMWAKDSSNDERLMKLVETSTTIMQEMRASIDKNSETMKELITEFRFIQNRKNG
tara:strand:- start:2439 stop:2798 length:360 start_codon:yes stop_codon:yes gene_type:complete